MRVVLDTNIWVSAFVNPLGTPGRILDELDANRLDVVTTEHLLTELREVVHRPKVRQLLESRNLWDDSRLVVAIHPRVQVVEDVIPRQNWLHADPDDDWVIQCAVTGAVEYIVTGDKAVLGLGEVEGIRIVSAARFVDEVLKVAT
jgi:putative PIN family toxin of toxin-antitoxin system